MTLDSRRFSLAVVVVLAIAAGTVAAQRSSSPIPSRPPTPTQAPDWVTRSNEHTRVLLQEQARLAPEGAAQLGTGRRRRSDHRSQRRPMQRGHARASTGCSRSCNAGSTAETGSAGAPGSRDSDRGRSRQQLRSVRHQRALLLPYMNAPQAIFNGLRALLDDQVPPERRRAALVRLRKYTGAETGFEPFTELALERVRERLATEGAARAVPASRSSAISATSRSSRAASTSCSRSTTCPRRRRCSRR